MICFYHSADFDGKCSAAIIKSAYPKVILKPINYGQEFPWEEINSHDIIFMVDFSLPFGSEMERFLSFPEKEIIWIDHHVTAIDKFKAWQKNNKTNADVVLEDGLAGCELTWKYIYPDKAFPLAVTLLGRYDVWNHDENNHTYHFQCGMRNFGNWDLEYDFDSWKRLFFDFPAFTNEILESGKIIYDYKLKENLNYAKAYSFEMTVENIKFLILNRGMANSQALECLFNEEKHDAMVLFVWSPKIQKWKHSIYTTKENIHVGRFAEKMGGGGHKKAAGWLGDKIFYM